MTNVTVKLSNGSARSFNTSYTSKDVVKSVAMNDLGFKVGANGSGLSFQQELELLAVLDAAFDPAQDNTRHTGEALAAAGIDEVIIGNPAPVAAPVAVDDEDDEDDEVPSADDLPVYRQTVEAQERPLTLTKSPVASKVADFKASATVSRTLAIVVAAGALVAGALLGGSIF